MKKKTLWTHKKFKKREYEGTYRYVADEREFVLKSVTKGQKHNVTFESHEAASKLGWVKK